MSATDYLEPSPNDYLIASGNSVQRDGRSVGMRQTCTNHLNLFSKELQGVTTRWVSPEFIKSFLKSDQCSLMFWVGDNPWSSPSTPRKIDRMVGSNRLSQSNWRCTVHFERPEKLPNSFLFLSPRLANLATQFINDSVKMIQGKSSVQSLCFEKPIDESDQIAYRNPTDAASCILRAHQNTWTTLCMPLCVGSRQVCSSFIGSLADSPAIWR